MSLLLPIVWLNAQVAVLENTRKILAGKNPNAITHQLSSLQQLMSHDFAQKLVDKGIIQDMVALVEPGTDASKFSILTVQ